MTHTFAAQDSRDEIFKSIKDAVSPQLGSDDLIHEIIGYLCGVTSAASPGMFSFVEDKQYVYAGTERELIRQIVAILERDWKTSLNPLHLNALLARLVEADQEIEARLAPMPAGYRW